MASAMLHLGLRLIAKLLQARQSCAYRPDAGLTVLILGNFAAGGDLQMVVGPPCIGNGMTGVLTIRCSMLVMASGIPELYGRPAIRDIINK
jgi:hypothetical protein